MSNYVNLVPAADFWVKSDQDLVLIIDRHDDLALEIEQRKTVGDGIPEDRYFEREIVVPLASPNKGALKITRDSLIEKFTDTEFTSQIERLRAGHSIVEGRGYLTDDAETARDEITNIFHNPVRNHLDAQSEIPEMTAEEWFENVDRGASTKEISEYLRLDSPTVSSEQIAAAAAFAVSDALSQRVFLDKTEAEYYVGEFVEKWAAEQESVSPRL
jgi:hypothetical protein